MKTSGYLTPVRIVFWVIMLACLAAIVLFVVGLFRPQGNARAACIMQQRHLQQAVRSYAATNILNIGDPINWSKIIGPGQLIERVPECRVHGKDAFQYSTTIPPVGTLVAPCKDPAHKPPNIKNW